MGLRGNQVVVLGAVLQDYHRLGSYLSLAIASHFS
jgi:hypothetical protein